MRILFVADVVGSPGREACALAVPALRRRVGADACVINAENAAAGAGLTRKVVDELLACGGDVLTGGNHLWDKKEVFDFVDDETRLVRPLNYPPGTPGRGVVTVNLPGGRALSVINLMGRVFMQPLDDPFRAANEALSRIREEGGGPVVVVDFHAEATSEKVAMGWFLDGRVSAVIGTHTHVATADARVLPGGTAYITDVGMTGPFDSVIGVEKELAIRKLRTLMPVRFHPAEKDVRLSAVVVDVDDETGHARSIERLEERVADAGSRRE
jgi:metallophosphoesterase (TIGR00282 family)